MVYMVKQVGGVFLGVVLVACGGGPTVHPVVRTNGSPSVRERLATPTAVATDCYFRLSFERGTVLLDFANRSLACSTLSGMLARGGPPFNGELTRLDYLNLPPSLRPVCIKSRFYSDVMAVYSDNGGANTAAAFCAHLLVQSPASA